MCSRGMFGFTVAIALLGVAFADESCDSTTGDALFQSRKVLSMESMKSLRNAVPTSKHPQVLELLARATTVLGLEVTPEVNKTINSLIKLIEDSIKVKLKQDQNYTQNEINAKIQEIKDSTATAVTFHESATASDNAWHDCVAVEKGLVEESEAVNAELVTKKDDMDSKCAASNGDKTWSATVPAELATLTCDFTQGNCDTRYGEYKTKLKEWYDGLEARIAVMKSEYDAEKTACEESTADHVRQTGLYTNATNKWKDERAKCDELQTAREVGMCVFGEKLQDTCKTKSEYEKLISDINAETGPLSVKERENEWASMELLKCMLKRHGSDAAFDEATMQACRTNSTFAAEVGTLDNKAGDLEGLAYTCTEATMTFNGKTCTVPEVTATTSAGYNCNTAFTPAFSSDLASRAFTFCGSDPRPAAAPKAAVAPPPPPDIPENLRFSPCGATGPNGPTQTQCDSEYGGTGVVQVSGGYQVYTVTNPGEYSIEANGAKGGNHGAGSGGYGAKVSGVTTLLKGDRLVVVCGQPGWDNPNNGDWGGAGGGGTYVAKVLATGGEDLKGPLVDSGLNVQILFAAGGGSGLEDRQNSGQAAGGQSVEGNPDTAAAGGSSGGGGGYKLNGLGGAIAKSFLNGGTGGKGKGGFGGGGGPYDGGGGGGGYDGGDCNIGGSNNACHGGTSFGGTATPNVNTGYGYVLAVKAR